MGGAYKAADELKTGEGNPWANLALDKLGRAPHAERRFDAEGYAGARRLKVDLEFKPQSKREKYTDMYLSLVDSVAGILKGEGVSGYDTKTGKNTYEGLTKEGKKQLQEDFITGIWGILYGNLYDLGVKYEENRVGFLYESLDKGLWACDNCSTLVFDVGRELGVPVEFVIVPEHTRIRTEDFFFETTQDSKPGYCSVDWLTKKRRVIYAITSKLEVIDSIAYDNRGTDHLDKEEYDEAIRDFRKVIELNPDDLDAQHSLKLAQKKKMQ
ncbi:MAG: tetratricopeptide repeat protein [Candidatus Micrarchaeota archaeon]|nr:tetratricopeptide repeat protein [Candidatus Micrarchaeota archaeon]